MHWYVTLHRGHYSIEVDTMSKFLAFAKSLVPHRVGSISLQSSERICLDDNVQSLNKLSTFTNCGVDFTICLYISYITSS